MASVCIAAGSVQFDLLGTDGAHHASAERTHSRATVLLFLGIDCPISNRYSPLLHRLEAEYERKGVRFFAVFSDPAINREQATAHLHEYDLPMTGLLDGGLTLAKQAGARVTPEAVVLSPAGVVLYRGRIDDQYVDWGKTRVIGQREDLRIALDEVLAGKPVSQAFTKALGCAIGGRDLP